MPDFNLPTPLSLTYPSFESEIGLSFRLLINSITLVAMAKMTRTQIIAALADKSGKSKKEVKDFLDMFEEMALSEVKKNGEFSVMNLGKLIKQNRAARMGRNPATGATINIPAKTVVKFRVAKACKDSVL